ncbi:unnamed protein product [Closterium sp. NIES-53]
MPFSMISQSSIRSNLVGWLLTVASISLAVSPPELVASERLLSEREGRRDLPVNFQNGEHGSAVFWGSSSVSQAGGSSSASQAGGLSSSASSQRGTPRAGLATLTGNVLTPQSQACRDRTMAVKTPSTATRTRPVPTRLSAAISDDSNIQVIVRVRPPAGPELTGYPGPGAKCVAQDGPKSLFLVNPDRAGAAEQFTFDHAAGESATQEDLFEVAGRPIVENCLSGYNSTMFAYGQTGSGKTYTMFGADVDKADVDRLRGGNADVEVGSRWGMIPRVFQLVFALMQQEKQQRAGERLTFICTCSFLEIYNEHFYDLLDPRRCNLHIREGPNGVYVENLTKQPVTCFAQVMELIQRGAKNRRVAGTNMNRESSRSHSVFTCNIESTWTVEGISNRRFGQLNLVDLAGSERQKSSGATGERLKEASSINTSLSQLGKVIMVLVESLRENKPRHVPYRDSYLTFLLQDSLGGNSKTTIIACISPFAGSFRESHSTLKFAQRAKLVHNKAVVNEAAEGEKDALKKEIARLKDMNEAAEGEKDALKKEIARLKSTSKAVVNEAAEGERDALKKETHSRRRRTQEGDALKKETHSRRRRTQEGDTLKKETHSRRRRT